jgi:crotonobetainyl-CoA:carnitine CoA-transferase CaiB-like acyl-CoA transferase
MALRYRRQELFMGPLAHACVLELGSTIAGPFCGRLLADFGADVVKVEPPTGDPVRSMGKHAKGKDGEDVSLYAATILRNKRLISVDMRTKAGQQVIRDLVKTTDVLIENFRPGGLEKWGLGYEDLKAIKPDLIMARISGFGQSGPYSPRPGFGIIGEAVSGLRLSRATRIARRRGWPCHSQTISLAFTQPLVSPWP